MTQKLVEIASIHELREIEGSSRKVEVGSFIEVNDFDVVTENVRIIEQWEVTDIKKEEKDGKEHYQIVCKKRDFEAERKIKEELVHMIIDKHGDILKSSFVKCLVEGIDIKTMNQLKSILYKLRGDVDDSV